MKFDFLQQFQTRMKVVGINSFIVKNSAQKTSWKQYGLETFDEQMNIIFALLLYMMEQSLRDEACTMDDIASFLDELNMTYLKKGWSYEQCQTLGDFIVNVILCDEGKAMYFWGFNFETGKPEKIHISYVSNKIVYQQDQVRRTSYYLTDDGYNLLLSTLEVESNMKLTIQEMIFKLHLEKATYDKAADDMKNIFNLLRMQYQKIQDAIQRIRKNALHYAVADYKALLEDNLDTIENTRNRFDAYREQVSKLVKDLTEQDIHIKQLDLADQSNLRYLEVIQHYLDRALDEHQRILISHFDIKALYAKELESLSQMAMIQRFDLRSELDDPLLDNVHLLERMEIFLRPLFNQAPEKIYNMNLALQKQIPLRRQQAEEEELLSFDEEAWQKKQIAEKLHNLRLYHDSLEFMLLKAEKNQGTITLSQLLSGIEEQISVLVPTVEIFQEIVVELLRNCMIQMATLRNERQNTLHEQALDFQLNYMLLDIFDAHADWDRFAGVYIQKLEGAKKVQISNVPNKNGSLKRVWCSDFSLQLLQIGESAWLTN